MIRAGVPQPERRISQPSLPQTEPSRKDLLPSCLTPHDPYTGGDADALEPWLSGQKVRWGLEVEPGGRAITRGGCQRI